MNALGQSVAVGLRHSALWRVLALGALTLGLFIPIAWIRDLIAERMTRRDQAVKEVSAKWGGQQVLSGPALVVPYVGPAPSGDGSELHHLTILPEHLQVHARVDGETRSRGIFAVPVYRVLLDVSGDFVPPDLHELGIDPAAVAWEQTQLAVGISDTRAIQSRAVVAWGDRQDAFSPGPGNFAAVSGGVHAGVGDPFQSRPGRFSFQLVLQGSGGLYFTPVGQDTDVSIASNWPSPSFQGDWLPAERTVDAAGFTARWQIPFLGRNQPQVWTSVSLPTGALCASQFGVDLIAAVDAHRMAERSVKYARLFVVFTFGTIWLIEVLGRVRVHPMQYLLIGAALCAFYLLELSLAEQLGFGVAYLTASTAVAALVGAYGVVVLRGFGRACGLTMLVAALYFYLYVLLTNEDYALLIGSIGIFVAIALTMFLTRRINWYAVEQPPASTTPVASMT